MNQFTITTLPLDGLTLITRNSIKDSRGIFERLFCADELQGAGWTFPVAQINHTITKKKGVVRGLHFQIEPYAETKFITCLQGAVVDFAIDLRRESSTYLKWYAAELSPENQTSLLIPEGFAHGFQTLLDDTELIYLHSKPYSPIHERGLNILDKKLNIQLPLSITEISDKDRDWPLL